MKTISILGQKGGSGKSTLAVHLSTEATSRGYVTAGIDSDPQKSLYNWYERREAHAPQITRETDADELGKLVQRAAKGGCEILIIDTSGRAEATMRAAAELADIILVPTKPEKFDLETLPVVWKVAKFAEKTAVSYIVMNQHQPLALGIESRAEKTVRDGLTRQGMQVAPTVMHRLNDYKDAVNDGRTAQEFDPRGRAAMEIRELFDWIQDCLGVQPQQAKTGV